MKFLARKYGLSAAEVQRLVDHPQRETIVTIVERFRDANGFPAPDSPLVRGLLLDMVNGL